MSISRVDVTNIIIAQCGKYKLFFFKTFNSEKHEKSF